MEKITRQEKKINKDIDMGKYISIDSFEEEKKKLMDKAKNHRKRTTISIRIPEEDLEKIKIKAQDEGIPYQTMINSIIHKFLKKQSIS